MYVTTYNWITGGDQGMWEWINTGFGTISVLGVIITAAASWSSRETNNILARQGEMLQGQRDVLERMERLEGRA